MGYYRLLTFASLLLATWTCVAQDDVTDVISEKRQVGKDERKSYFLIPPIEKKEPQQGFGLLVIIPGGDGSADFHPFIKRIRKNAVPDDFAVAQPVAFKWTDEQDIVWPAGKLKVEKQEFSTEEFVTGVIEDVARLYPIDCSRVFCMGWSSSGPAVYAVALSDQPLVAGCYVAMSVYKPLSLPPLSNSKGLSVYIEHSPEDRICPYWMARKAFEDLKREGARTLLQTYNGGHGWRGNVYERIKSALQWLQDSNNNG